MSFPNNIPNKEDLNSRFANMSLSSSSSSSSGSSSSSSSLSNRGLSRRFAEMSLETPLASSSLTRATVLKTDGERLRNLDTFISRLCGELREEEEKGKNSKRSKKGNSPSKEEAPSDTQQALSELYSIKESMKQSFPGFVLPRASDIENRIIEVLVKLEDVNSLTEAVLDPPDSNIWSRVKNERIALISIAAVERSGDIHSLVNMCDDLSKKGNFALAKMVAEKIRSLKGDLAKISYGVALVCISKELVKAGKFDDAIHTAKGILTFSKKDKDAVKKKRRYSYNVATTRIFRALAEKQGTKEALQKVADLKSTSSAYLAISQILAEKGNVDEAFEIANQIILLDKKNEAYAYIATILEKSRRPDKQILEKLYNVALQDRTSGRMNFFIALVKAYAKAGDAAGVSKTIREISSPLIIRQLETTISTSLAQASTDLIESENYEQACGIFQGEGDRLPYDIQSSVEYTVINRLELNVKSAIGRGDFTKATELAFQIPYENRRDFLFREIIAGLCERGEIDEAIRIAMQIETSGIKGRAFTIICKALVKAGRYEEAISRVNSDIETDEERKEALKAISEVLVDMREFQKVYNTLGLIDDLKQEYLLSLIDQFFSLRDVENDLSFPVEIATRWQNIEKKIESLIHILKKASRHPRFEYVYDAAFQNIKMIQAPETKMRFLINLLKERTSEVVLRKAIEIIREMGEPGTKIRFLLTIFEAIKSEEVIREAYRVIQEVADPNAKIRFLLSIYETKGDLGVYDRNLLDEARRVAATVEDSRSRFKLLVTIFEAEARVRGFDTALSFEVFLQTVQVPEGMGDDAIEKFCEHLCTYKYFEAGIEASRLAESIVDPERKNRLKTYINESFDL